MDAVNTSMQPVEVAPGQMLAVADGRETNGAENGVVRDITVTDHVRALAESGAIALLDSTGRRRNVKPPEGDTGGKP